MVQGLLCKATFATDAVHELELVAAAGGASLYKPAEAIGVRIEADVGQRAHAEEGVSYPGVTVVPVHAPAGSLGERGGRGRGHGPGNVVHQGLYNERGAEDVGLVGAVVTHVGGPFSPPFDGVFQSLIQLRVFGGRGTVVVQHLGGHGEYRESAALPGSYAHYAFKAVISGRRNLRVAGDEEPIVAADGAVDVHAFLSDPGLIEP